MKQIDLVRNLEQNGCVLIRHGGNHDWSRNPKTGFSQPVPRHREINELLAKHILKKLAD
jgi:mRNA interferase HicA